MDLCEQNECILDYFTQVIYHQLKNESKFGKKNMNDISHINFVISVQRSVRNPLKPFKMMK